ncbi:MAG: PrsW family intramembrane metalloprotease [Planctomycetales bacterium]|nr:PrsW family intramembrane metalloprotease [Planctomycetales bacterium]
MKKRTMHWRQTLRIRTQDPTFLWRMVIGILAAGVLAAYLMQFVAVESPPDRGQQIAMAAALGETSQALRLFEQMLADSATEPEDVFRVLRSLARAQSQSLIVSRFGSEIEPQTSVSLLESAAVDARLKASSLSVGEKQISLALWRSLLAGDPAALAALDQVATKSRYLQHALGVFYEAMENPFEAAVAYEREGALTEAERARKRAVELYLQIDDVKAVERLAKDPLYRDAIPAFACIRMAVERRDWATVWREIPRGVWQRFTPGAASLAVIAGIGWLLIALQSGQILHARGARWWLCLAAIPLGVLSVWPTLFLLYWQEATWGLEDRGDVVSGVRYHVLSVGLREEFCKLLLLLPLMPWLVRRRNELETLIVSACVGLGFAIEENAGYFAVNGGNTVGRFLTANFFHMASTGLVGLAFARGIWHVREKGLEFLAVFGVIVFAHGFYDAAIGVAALAQYGIASAIIYILLAYQFFHELRGMRATTQETISLTANFLGCVSLLASFTLIYLSYRFGLEMAARLLVPELLSTALMGYMFLREMPNSLLRNS